MLQINLFMEIGTDDFRVDNYSRAFQYLVWILKLLLSLLHINPDDLLLSLSNRDPVTSKHREGNKIFNTSIKLYDSLGTSHELTFNFAILEKGDWVVEVTSVPDENGNFEYITNEADAVIASGRLTFDTDGNFSGGTIPRLTLNWANDGSVPSEIVIDWDEALSGAGIK